MKNKYQEALNKLKYETCHLDNVSEPIKILQELVNKSISDKIIKKLKEEYTQAEEFYQAGKNDSDLTYFAGKADGLALVLHIIESNKGVS